MWPPSSYFGRTWWRHRCSAATWRPRTSPWSRQPSTAWRRSRAECWWTPRMQCSATETTRWGGRAGHRDVGGTERRSWSSYTESVKLPVSAPGLFTWRFVVPPLSAGVNSCRSWAQPQSELHRQLDVATLKLSTIGSTFWRPSKPHTDTGC